MKKNKLIASAIAAVFMLALTGCDLTIRDKYVPVSVGDVKKTSDGVYELYITNDKGYETVDGNEKAINCSQYGTTWAEQSSSTLNFKNPLAELNPKDYTKVTVEFKMYAEKVMTYSGAFGMYDEASGGFLWFTNANCFINTTANNASYADDFWYFDYNKGDIAAGATDGLKSWKDIRFEITRDSVEYYVDDVKAFDLESVAGTSNREDSTKGFEFLFKMADTCRVGTGVTFWDNPGADTWISDITISVE